MKLEPAICNACGYKGFVEEFLDNDGLCTKCLSDNWDQDLEREDEDISTIGEYEIDYGEIDDEI